MLQRSCGKQHIKSRMSTGDMGNTYADSDSDVIIEGDIAGKGIQPNESEVQILQNVKTTSAPPLEWNTDRFRLLATTVKTVFLDGKVPYGQVTQSWKTVSEICNNHPTFSCEDPNYVKHNSTKFQQKFDREAKKWRAKIGENINISGKNPMTDIEVILDDYCKKVDAKKDESEMKTLNSQIKAGNHAAAEFGMNLIPGRDAQSVIANGISYS